METILVSPSPHFEVHGIMDHYVKGDTREIDRELPFPPELTAGVSVMKIKPGTRLRNITTYVHRIFKVG